MKEDHVAYLGNKHVWGGEEPFGIPQPDRRNHLLVIGQTGVGKSTALKNLVAQDIHAGFGVAVLDPHGDFAEEVLNLIPSWRTEDVVYFNPADLDFPVGLNVLHSFPKQQASLVASGIVSAFKHIYHASWGPRLEYILFASIAALAECENTSLLGVQRMLTDKRYRAWVVKQVKDPMVRTFWNREFDTFDKDDAVSPVLNKVGQLFMAPPIRNVLGQVRSKINARYMMDNNKVFIANLSKGALGEDKSHLIGALLVNQFQLAAMSRSDTPEQERKDFLLIADEFPNFASDSFINILSEARKYRLCLTLANQFMGQLTDKMREAVLGNVGSIVSFRVGAPDAKILEEQFGGAYPANQFTELGNHEVVIKQLSRGKYQEPFRGKTWPPLKLPYERRERLIRRSQEKYSTPRSVVENKIERWLRLRM